MRLLWRGGDQVLRSHAEWLNRIDPKNRQPGTSAPTLAAAWAGIAEVYGALATQPGLGGFVIDEIVVEAQATVDAYRGGRRNHDLVLRGRIVGDEGLVICIEAKAGEDFGRTVADQRTAAQTVKESNARSNASERVAELIERFVPGGHPPERTDGLRYQLLTALAGTLSEAVAVNARHAVMMIHDFRTDERDDEVAREHDVDLQEFCTIVFDRELPGREQEPWCISLGQLEDAPGVELYLARAVTDLSTAALRATRG